MLEPSCPTARARWWPPHPSVVSPRSLPSAACVPACLLADRQAELPRPLPACLPLDLVQGWGPYSSHLAPFLPAGTISHLSTSFQLLGRSADWDTFGLVWPSKSNPACCLLLRRYKRGYAKDMKRLGYEPTSAYPLAQSTYRQLLDHLHLQAEGEGDALSATLLWRDGCAISNLWGTALRGHDAGILRVSGVKGADGRPVLPFTKAPSAGEYLVYPWSTKVNQVEPCEPIPVEYPRCAAWYLLPCQLPWVGSALFSPAGPFFCPVSLPALAIIQCRCVAPSFPPCSDEAEQRYSFIYWLWRLEQASTTLQQPLCDFLFRPTEGQVFLERPLTSAAIHDRFITHLQRSGLYQGGLTMPLRVLAALLPLAWPCCCTSPCQPALPACPGTHTCLPSKPPFPSVPLEPFRRSHPPRHPQGHHAA